MVIRAHSSVLFAVFLCGLAMGSRAKDGAVLFTETFDSPAMADGLPEEWRFFTGIRSVSIDTEHARSKPRALKLVDTDPTQAVGLRTGHLEIKPGLSYVAEWWYYGKLDNHQALYIEFWDAHGKRLAGHSFTSRGEGQWVRCGGRATAPLNAATLTLHFNSYSTNQATGWFDDVTLRPSTRVSQLLRKPYPPAEVSHPCGLYRAEDIERARQNLARHEWGKDVVDALQREAAFWMGVPDDKLAYWIPELTPFRVVDCPECGAGWRFAWSGGPDRISCRKCDFSWPNPDYPEGHSETYPDPVGGTQSIPYYRGKPSAEYGSAKSEVYRFSGRLRHHRVGRLRSLGAVGKMYAISEEAAYAETVRRVLLRLAEVYPHYLPHNWNRIFKDYRNLQSGKLSGWKLSDAGIFIQLTTAYDLTYNSGVYSDQDKVRIEEGCFREFARLMTATSPRGCCINDGPTAMGAGALAGLMLGDHDTIAWAIEPPDGFLGFIEKYFVRDGHWYEASPSYEGMSIHPLYITPEALRGYSDPTGFTDPDRYDNLDLLAHPLMKKMLIASAHCVMPDGHLPPTNDSTWKAAYSWRLAEKNLFWNPTEKNRRLLAWAMGDKAGKTGDEYALFRRDPDIDLAAIDPWSPSAESIAQPGVGWAILRTGDSRNDAAMFLDYGPKGSGHGHPDRLNIIYYDRGAELVTDLGYLGWGHPNHPWIRSTASHNQVIVDGEPHGAAGGELESFSGDGPVQGLVASAPRVYGETTNTFRRHLIFVDHGLGDRYLVDCFEVRGGNDHQYAFHGDGESFRGPDLTFTPIATDQLGNPKTGYQYLKNTRQARIDDAFDCTWIADPASGLGVRLHMLGQEGTTLIAAEANGLRNRKTPFADVLMHPIYVRRQGPENRFVSVIHAVDGQDDDAVDVERVQARADQGWCEAVSIRRGKRRDIAIIGSEKAAEAGIHLPAIPGIRSNARMALISMEDGLPRVLWALDGKAVAADEMSLELAPRVSARVVDIDRANHRITLDAIAPAPARLEGQYLLVTGRSDGAYRIESALNREGRAILTLADQPVINIPDGADISIVPAASIHLVSGRTADLHGDLGRATWPAGATGPAFLRQQEGSWEAGGAVSAGKPVSIASADMSGRELRLTVSRHDLAADTAPPRVTRVLDDRGNTLPSAELGYRPGLRAIRFVIEEDVAIAPATVSATLHARLHPSRPLAPSLTQGQASRWQLDCRLPDDLDPDQFTLTVTLADEAFNRVEHTLTFNTLGLVLPFRSMDMADSSGKVVKYFDHLDTRFYRSEEAGDFVTFVCNVPKAGRYRVALVYSPYHSYGIVQPYLNDKPAGKQIDFYARELAPGAGWADLGSFALDEGEQTVRLELVGRNKQANGAFIGVCSLVLTPGTSR